MILGLDLGTNSIGFALIGEESIRDIGSHIFSSGRSSAQERTFYKSRRTNYKRRKQRISFSRSFGVGSKTIQIKRIPRNN